MSEADDNLVLMARIGAAHGIRGEVRVKAFGDDPLSFTDYGTLVTRKAGKTFEIERARVQKTVVVTKFVGIDDRNAAEELNGLELFITRDQLPDLEDDEFYHEDLVGMTVTDMSGEPLGKIVTVQDFGAGDLLEVRPRRGATYYLPFTKAFVPEIDLEAGIVKADLPDDYFSESRSETDE